MKLSPKQILIIVTGLVVVIGLVAIVILNIRPTQKSQEVKLVVWGTDDRDAFRKVADSYHQFRPNAQVEYVQLNENQYEGAVLNALAAGQGPDVFMIGNRALSVKRDKLIPVNPRQFSLVNLHYLFPTVIEQDFVSGGGIYALPLYLDTLSLFYNKELFDQAGVVEPPKTWEDFQQAVAKLRVIKGGQQIVRAAAAIGGSERSIPSAVDLLHLLMLQNGTQMVTPDLSTATFAEYAQGKKSGVDALNFYLQFANTASPYYTWNDTQENAIDSFAGGKTAMMFGYESDLALLKSKSPFLRIGVAPIPQPAKTTLAVNYPRYVGLAVSKQSKISNWAWDFILYAASNPAGNGIYLDNTLRPPALRSLISQKSNDVDLAVFVGQALTARSWYEVDAARIEGIFNAAIQDVLSGRVEPEKALRQAQDQVTQLLRASQ